jgi:hypothetical protein
MLAISNCSAAAAPYTNAIIYIPNGRYLVMPTLGNGGGYALGSIIVTRGGLHFKGESRDQAVLLGRGAWQSYYGVADGSYPFRGFLVQIAAPITNDLPIIFESLTLDGGVQRGYVDAANARGRVNEVDGLGWDEQHGAYLTYDRGNNTGTASLQILTNIAAVHWRGEIIKSIDGNVNGRISIRNSVIGDGSATALNVYPAWDVRDNVFSNLFQIAELYQQYYRTTGYFCNNFATNIWGNGFAFNGCVWSAPPFIMQSNTFYFTGSGMNGIQTMPGANIAIIDNQIHCANYMSAICIGAPGAQVIDGMYNSNILISGNSIYAPAKLTAVFAFAPDEVNQVEKLTICSNTITAPEQIFYVVRSGGNQHNVRFFENTINSQLVEWQTGVPGTGKGNLTLVETNNRYTPWPNYFDTVKTNTISYVKGPKHRMDYIASGNKFILQDSISNQLPHGAVIEIDNRNNRWAALHGGSGGDIVIQTSENPAKPSHILPTGQKMTFHWVNGIWSTNAAPPAPPSNLRLR